MEDDPLISLEKATVEMLGGISVKSLRRLIACGELPPVVKVLSSPRLFKSDVVAYRERLKAKRKNGGMKND